MDRDCPLFWLIPENEGALRIVHDEANSRFRDTVPVISTRQTPAANVEETVECLRVGFDHEPKEDCLLKFGRDPFEAHIILTESYYSRHQTDLYIDPTSLDLICRDYSFYKTTSLLFNDDSGAVGRWCAVDDTIIEQAILPSSNPILAIRGAHFTFRWYPSSKEREI